jgi:simple sugar transport system substrate-binding protein
VNGVAAGLCTSTDKLGFVAGMPFGAVLLNVNSFLMGARQTNPRQRSASSSPASGSMPGTTPRP